MSQGRLAIILANVRSVHNVGAILRTADAVGATEVACCGITPYPQLTSDPRPTFEAARTTAALAKTALGAESFPCRHFDSVLGAIEHYRGKGYDIVALEQTEHAVDLFDYKPRLPLALIVGHEVTGLDAAIVETADAVVEIPMHGAKESLNVSVATGVALYQLRKKLD